MRNWTMMLGDGDQHDVHNTDAAYEEGDGGDAAQEILLHLSGVALLLLVDIVGVHAVKTVVAVDDSAEKAFQTGNNGTKIL